MERTTYHETNRIHAEMIAAGVPCYLNGMQATALLRIYGASTCAWDASYGQNKLHRLEIAKRIAEHNDRWN